MSGVYEELGVRPLINAAGTQTRYGGVPLPEEVVQAMRDLDDRAAWEIRA